MNLYGFVEMCVWNSLLHLIVCLFVYLGVSVIFISKGSFCLNVNERCSSPTEMQDLMAIS